MEEPTTETDRPTAKPNNARRNEILLGLGSLAAIGLMVAWAMGWVG